jgi:hypothetical protein
MVVSGRSDGEETTMRNGKVAGATLAGCAAILWWPGPALAAQAMHQHQHPGATAQAKPGSAMADKCKAMMAEHEKMMADMNAADQRLDGLVATMNSATGQAKVDATAAVVSELVAQRKAMRDRMMSAEHGMMGHMMEHMQAGKESMAMCPMMKTDSMKH